MKCLRSFVILVFTPSTSLLFAAPNREVQEGANHLTASIYTGPAMRTLQELSDGFGGRLTGSPSYNQAAEWAAGKFRSYGIKNVKLEPFAMDNGWALGTAHGQLLSPGPRAVHLESLGWSPPAPAVASTGEALTGEAIAAPR